MIFSYSQTGWQLWSAWRCLLGLAPAYLVELCGPTLSYRSFRSIRLTEQRLLRVSFAHRPTYIRQKRVFSMIGPSTWNSLLSTLCSLTRTLSHAILSQLALVLFGCIGVGS